MDTSLAGILASFIVSTIGFSIFLYGKKQARPPQLVAGLLMLACPLALPSAVWVGVGGVVLTAGLWAAVRAGY